MVGASVVADDASLDEQLVTAVLDTTSDTREALWSLDPGLLAELSGAHRKLGSPYIEHLGSRIEQLRNQQRRQ